MGLGNITNKNGRSSGGRFGEGSGLPRLSRLLTFALLVSAGPSWAAQSLEQINFAALPGEKVEVRLSLSGPAAEPGSFTIDNPPRIALDLPDTQLGLEKRNQEIGIGATKSVRAVEAGNRTRVVINLNRLTPHSIRTEGNEVVVTIAGSSSDTEVAATPAQPAPAARPPVSAPAPASEPRQASSLSVVDFRRGEAGEGRVIVRLTDPTAAFDVQEKGGQIVVDFLNTRVPENLRRRLNVVDFATPVKTIDTTQTDGRARLTISPTGEYQHLAYQTGDIFTLEVKPVTPEQKEKAQKEKAGYTGERLSLNFQNIEVRAVLQLLADFTGFNLVTSDTVTGNVTLRLKNVPWDQAMDIILKTKGLAMRKMGNVILVAPAEEIAAREKAELQAQQQIAQLAPLRNESIQVNYAKAEDMAKLIKSEANNLISERGSVTVDTRTNKLLVKETQENLDAIRALVQELDIPVRQVLVESRIVIANDDFSRDLGVRFGAHGVTGNGRNGVIAAGTGPQGTTTHGSASDAVQGALTNYQATNQPFPIYPNQNRGYNVNLPAAAGNGPALALAILGSDYLIDLELSALQSEGRGEVISNPRVVTANQRKASIEQGVEIPYWESSSSGAATVSFKKAVLRLEVTPQITPDERIIMDLGVNKDSVGQVFSGIPSINTREVNTQVLVNNGETIVLGGIYEQEKTNQESKVPVLGDLPVLGRLFKSDLNVDKKLELLIFVTPKIIREGINAGMAP